MKILILYCKEVLIFKILKYVFLKYLILWKYDREIYLKIYYYYFLMIKIIIIIYNYINLFGNMFCYNFKNM